MNGTRLNLPDAKASTGANGSSAPPAFGRRATPRPHRLSGPPRVGPRRAPVFRWGVDDPGGVFRARARDHRAGTGAAGAGGALRAWKAPRVVTNPPPPADALHDRASEQA